MLTTSRPYWARMRAAVWPRWPTWQCAMREPSGSSANRSRRSSTGDVDRTLDRDGGARLHADLFDDDPDDVAMRPHAAVLRQMWAQLPAREETRNHENSEGFYRPRRRDLNRTRRLNRLQIPGRRGISRPLDNVPLARLLQLWGFCGGFRLDERTVLVRRCTSATLQLDASCS